MQELSLTVLDIAENSAQANATNVKICIVQNTNKNLQTLTIQDNGKGMSKKMVENAFNPFFTTRTTRKVGLGLSFLKMNAELTGGSVQIESIVKKGTTVTANFNLDHVNRTPLGDMASTMAALIQGNPNVVFEYIFEKDGAKFAFSSKQVQEILEDIPINTPCVTMFIKGYIAENMQQFA